MKWACAWLTHTGHSHSLGEHVVVAAAAAFPALMFFPTKGRRFLRGSLCFSSQWAFPCYLWLEVWKSWLINYSTLSLKHSESWPTIFPAPTLLCTIHGVAEAFVCQRDSLESMGTSWSSLRWQNWAWDTENINIQTICRPAQGQTANVCVVNVEETFAKSSLDLQIPGVVLPSSHTGVMHLLLPLPMAVIRWMKEWERVLLGHLRVSVSAAE